MRFTSQDATNIRKDIQKALKEVAEKYNAEISLGNIHYGDDLRVKLVFYKKSGNRVLTPQLRAYKARADDMNLPLELLDETFTYEGKVYKLIGYNTRARKFPIEYTAGGQQYKCSVLYFKKLIEKVGKYPEYYV
jgi:hypothetical protein